MNPNCDRAICARWSYFQCGYVQWLLAAVGIALAAEGGHGQEITHTLKLGKSNSLYHRKVALAPQGSMLAVAVNGSANEEERSSHIRLIDIKSQKETARLRSSSPLSVGNLLAFTPDGKSLVQTRLDWGSRPFNGVSRCDLIEVWDVEKRKLRLAIKVEGIEANRAILHPDGTSVVVADTQLGVYNLVTGKRTALFKAPEEVHSVAISPDGKWLATSHPKGKIVFWDFKKRKVLGTATVKGPRRGAKLAFCPDSKKLVVVPRGYHIHLFDVATRKSERTLDPRNETAPIFPEDMAFTPDGKTVVFAGADLGQGIVLWDVTTGNLSRPKTERDARFTHNCMALSKDGKLLVTGSKVLQFWKMPKK